MGCTDGLYITLKIPAHAEQCSEVSTQPLIQLIRGLALAAREDTLSPREPYGIHGAISLSATIGGK